MVAKLERVRLAVVERGIIPRREGSTGLPTEVYYLKVAELDYLLEHPEESESYIERARARSRKRRRKKYVKERELEQRFAGEGQSERVLSVLQGDVKCLGHFKGSDRFVSETGFARATSGYIYEVSTVRIALSESEAEHAWVRLGIPLQKREYKEPDLASILWRGVDRMYRPLLEET